MSVSFKLFLLQIFCEFFFVCVNQFRRIGVCLVKRVFFMRVHFLCDHLIDKHFKLCPIEKKTESKKIL